VQDSLDRLNESIERLQESSRKLSDAVDAFIKKTK